MKKITLLGAGCWGVTLGALLFKKGYSINFWEYDEKKAEELIKKRTLKRLPHLKLDKEIKISTDLEELLRESEILIFAVPSQVFRETAKKALIHLGEKIELIISATKGLERKTCSRMSEILKKEFPENLKNKIAALSGPSHAEEVSQEFPTAVVIASENEEVLTQAQKIFFSPFLRVYTQKDIIGVEFAGAAKNVYAIASGISDGLNLGDNSKAALLTRSLAEMQRLGEKIGAKKSTFLGLAGVGDLVVTCYSRHSRNRQFGELIAKGKEKEKALQEIGMVVEGFYTVESLCQLAEEKNVELPIAKEIYQILFLKKDCRLSMRDLLSREMRAE
jgi:glycerol-3-phosphate dehydrogenase (NAD(P)+)